MKDLMVLKQNDHRQKLLEEGYCVIESVFLPEELSRIKEVSLKHYQNSLLHTGKETSLRGV